MRHSPDAIVTGCRRDYTGVSIDTQKKVRLKICNQNAERETAVNGLFIFERRTFLPEVA